MFLDGTISTPHLGQFQLIPDYEYSSIKFYTIFYTQTKNFSNLTKRAIQNVLFANVKQKQQLIYFIFPEKRKLYGSNYLNRDLNLPHLTPQSTIFGFLDISNKENPTESVKQSPLLVYSQKTATLYKTHLFINNKIICIQYQIFYFYKRDFIREWEAKQKNKHLLTFSIQSLCKKLSYKVVYEGTKVIAKDILYFFSQLFRNINNILSPTKTHHQLNLVSLKGSLSNKIKSNDHLRFKGTVMQIT